MLQMAESMGRRIVSPPHFLLNWRSMKKLLSIVLIGCLVGCNDTDSKTQDAVSSPLAFAVIDGVCIDQKAIDDQIDFRMGIFEVNRLLNFAMRRIDLKKVRGQQHAKFEKVAKDEVIFKELILAAAKKSGISARQQDIDRIRGQYEMTLGRRAGSYEAVTSTVAKVGFL